MQSLFEQIQTGKIWDIQGGVHPPSRKELTNQKPIAVLPLPDRLYLPLRQHIGAAGQLLVKEGDRVLKGQALTSSSGAMVVPIHAPTSGTVLEIKPHTGAHPSALPELTLVLEPDGKDEWRERVALNLATADKSALLNRIQQSGIAGMGGAGFPTHVKASSNQVIEYLIINAVECEPYITADDLLMQEAATTIVKGIDILCQLLNPKAVLVGIEDDKPFAIAAMKAACNQRDNYYVRVVPAKYPSGGEKQLIQLLTGQEVPNGKRPADIGIVMQNVGTTFAIAQAVLDDHPLISRVVTVTGQTLNQPQNVLALLGTPVSALLDACGFQAEQKQRVIMGGPMMGFTLPDLSVPVIKTTNCILAPTAKELPAAQDEMDCIRCSACADACPASLLPQQLFWYSKAKDSDKLKEYNLIDCIECGACAYVCPSEIPLVQYYRVAKAHIREEQQEAAKAEQAKARFEARNERLEKEKQERALKNQQLAAARQQQQAQSGASNAVADALARIKAKQAKDNEKQSPDDNAPLNKESIIAERELKKQQAREYQEKKAQLAEQNDKAPLSTETTASKSDAVAAAIARAKAKKLENAKDYNASEAEVPEPSPLNEAASDDPRKAAVAAALARAKAKKLEAEQDSSAAATQAPEPTPLNEDAAEDPRKAAVAAALARAKAKKLEGEQDSNTAATQAPELTPLNEDAAEDPRKAAVAAALARAKAKKLEGEQESNASATQAPKPAPLNEGSAEDPRKAAVAAAIARAKAKKQTDSENP